MKIDIVPYCGLGNRINVLANALALQTVAQHEITLFWDKTWDCRAWFDELFLPIEGLRVQRLSKFYMKSPGKRQLWLPRLLRSFVYDKCYKARRIHDSEMLLTKTPTDGKIFVEGNRPFCPVVEQSMLSRYFVPIPEIQQRIEQFVARYTSYTIGVHVRRTDHRAVIASNPLEGYVAEMKRQQKHHPNCLFYIASDDTSVKAFMRSLFPGRVLTLEELSLDRNSVSGMQDSVLELFCLAKANLIIGSKGSTYSALATKLFDTPIVY
ncbi:MAG: hypothetical protein KBT12_06805 [Bacteroidales bacterium]|nr:hypothetical protein [Candidatus Physcousia equi]